MDKNIRIGPFRDAGEFRYYKDGSARPVAHQDPYTVDLDGDGVEEVLFGGLETQPNTPEDFSNISMHIFGWKEGQFQDLTDAWLPGDMRHFEGIGEFVPGDFNNDGRTDLFLAGYADMDHFVQPYALINERDHFSRQALPEVIGWQHGAGAGDINGDGYDDVYAAGYGYEPPVSRRMYWGEEDGLKEAEFKQDADGSGLTLADFLGDGSVTAMVVDSGVEGLGTADGGTVLARIEETPDGDASIEVISRLPPPYWIARPKWTSTVTICVLRPSTSPATD